LAHVADSALSGWNERKADTAERERRDAMAKSLDGMIDPSVLGPDPEQAMEYLRNNPELAQSLCCRADAAKDAAGENLP
jgi:hypothetical protein